MILQFIFPFHPQITLKVVIGKRFEKLEWSAHDKRRTKMTQRNREKIKRPNEIDKTGNHSTNVWNAAKSKYPKCEVKQHIKTLYHSLLVNQKLLVQTISRRLILYRIWPLAPGSTSTLVDPRPRGVPIRRRCYGDYAEASTSRTFTRGFLSVFWICPAWSEIWTRFPSSWLQSAVAVR